jgi:hypothetical protein
LSTAVRSEYRGKKLGKGVVAQRRTQQRPLQQGLLQQRLESNILVQERTQQLNRICFGLHMEKARKQCHAVGTIFERTNKLRRQRLAVAVTMRIRHRPQVTDDHWMMMTKTSSMALKLNVRRPLVPWLGFQRSTTRSCNLVLTMTTATTHLWLIVLGKKLTKTMRMNKSVVVWWLKSHNRKRAKVKKLLLISVVYCYSETKINDGPSLRATFYNTGSTVNAPHKTNIDRGVSVMKRFRPFEEHIIT